MEERLIELPAKTRQDALQGVSRQFMGQPYQWGTERACSGLVRAYGRLACGATLPEQPYEAMGEREALKTAIRAGGLANVYRDALCTLEDRSLFHGWREIQIITLPLDPAVKYKRRREFAVGDLVFVGHRDAPTMESNLGTTYRATDRHVLLGLIEPGMNVLHWTERGLSTLKTDWVPWVNAQFRLHRIIQE